MKNKGYLADIYLDKAYYIDESRKGEKDNVKLFTRDNKPYPKFSVHGLKVRSRHTAEKLSTLNVGQRYLNYTRVL